MTYFRRTFAQSGDKTAVPIDDPSDGSVSYETGYGAQYSQDPTTTATARRIERPKYNQLLSDITTEVQRYQQNAWPEFITTSDNGGSPFSYSKGATVRYSGSVYRSLIDSNTSTPADDSISWLNIDYLRPGYSAKSASYTITNTDNIRSLEVTTGASNATVNLPTPGTLNTGRLIDIKKADSGTGSVIVSGTNIDGASTVTLYTEGNSFTIVGTGSGWAVIRLPSPEGHVLLDTGNGHGSTDTNIRRFTNATVFGDAFTHTGTAANGSAITAVRPMIAYVTYTDRYSIGSAAVGFSNNAAGADLTTNILSLAAPKKVQVVTLSNDEYGNVSAMVKLAAGDIIRPHTNGTPDNTTDNCQFKIFEAVRLKA
jgi:hypothetical protein